MHFLRTHVNEDLPGDAETVLKTQRTVLFANSGVHIHLNKLGNFNVFWKWGTKMCRRVLTEILETQTSHCAMTVSLMHFDMLQRILCIVQLQYQLFKGLCFILHASTLFGCC